MSKMTIKCEGFCPWRRNTLCGFAEITISELHLRIKDIALHEKGNSRWAQLPAKPQIKDGAIVKDDSGKAQYIPILEFTGREVRDAFSAAVIRAVLEHTPSAFDDEPAKVGAKKPADVASFHDDQIPF
jgi:hypothetical protein